jgi:dTDP-4-amino-4,6-dideoxygalactose transaminase
MSNKTITKIPLLDLNAQYKDIKSDVMSAIEEVIDSKQFILGAKVKELETDIASYCGVNHAVGVSSGSDALIIALMAIDIKPGDEVITSPFTFFATAGAISRLGAIPVFVDIDPDTYNIDPRKIEEKVTSKTKAIVPVHLFGQMADMDPIMAIANKHTLFVIEDGAQAIGSTYTSDDGIERKAGSIGHIGCFSFFPSKNLGGCGDGGIVTTNDETLFEKMKVLRVHGSKPKYYHSLVGGNFRLDTIQAAILLVKLPLLEGQHEGRRKNADILSKNITSCITPVIHEKCKSIYNQYTVRSDERDKLIVRLKENNIGHAIYYPVCLHLQDCFSYLGYKEGGFPEAEKASKEVFSIPVYPELSNSQLGVILEVINNN